MPPKFDMRVVVIGGGIAGFAAAVGLKRKGYEVLVLERSAELQTWGGALLIPANALRVLEDYGLLERFREVAEKWDDHVVYRHDGMVLDILGNRANEKVFGYEMLNVPRKTYQRVLYEAAVREGVDVRFGCRVEKIEDGGKGPSVTLTTGETIECDLIVGADGIKSTVRPTVLGGVDVKLQPNSTCYQCTISSTDMLSSPLTSPLIKERGIQSWWGPNTHFICGRKQNGASYDASFFIHPTKENPLPAYHASASNSQEADNSRKGDITQILQNVDAYEPRVKEFVKLIKPENCMLWKVAQLPDLSSWVSSTGRIVVLGDAAHAMSPHLGQGAAMSIEDGGVLSECLSRCSSISDIPMAVRVYERIQKPRAERVKKAAEISGVWKAMTEGKEREQRDKGFEERLRKGEKYEFFRASGHLGWLYGWDFQKTASKELDKAFPGGNGKGERAKI